MGKFQSRLKFVGRLGKKAAALAIIAGLIVLYNLIAKANPGSSAPKNKVGTFWQLYDDSELSVFTKPWPPRSGPNVLVAKITPPNASDDPYGGIIFVRLSSNPDSKERWQPMRKVGVEDGNSTVFETGIPLASGKTYIQFRVPGNPRGPQELTDWSVVVP